MPRKKRSAWGNLTQVEPNVYRIRYWGKGTDGQYRRRSCTVRGSRKDAERRRAELMLAHSDDAPCPTVGDVWESYALPDMGRRVESGDMSANTQRTRCSVWRAHVEPRWSAVQCDAVRPLQIQQWLYELPLNAARNGLKLLRNLLDYAVRYELIDHNPARERYIMPSKSTVTKHSATVWSLDELGGIWQRARGQWWEGAFLLCAFGGLRVGEALGVQTQDVRATIIDGTTVALVSVQRQVSRYGVEETLKTANSRRTVAVPGLAGLRIIQLAKERDGWLTGDGLGGPTSQQRLTYSWYAAFDAMGMEHVPFTNLRNSWQTNMRWTMKMQPYYIEVLMGHAGRDVSSIYYDRPDADMLARVVADAYAANPYDAGWTWAR